MARGRVECAYDLRIQSNLEFVLFNLTRDFGEDAYVGALDLEYKDGPWAFWLFGYAKSEALSGDTFGSYFTATYRICEPLELHAAFDIRSEHGCSQTLGIRLFPFQDGKTDLTVDYIHGTEDFGSDGDTLALRLRHRF